MLVGIFSVIIGIIFFFINPLAGLLCGSIGIFIIAWNLLFQLLFSPPLGWAAIVIIFTILFVLRGKIVTKKG
jgi:hypothetical protein